MRRIGIEIPIAAVAAALMASVVLIAGTAIASRQEEPLRYVFQPALCTASYCEPAPVRVERGEWSDERRE